MGKKSRRVRNGQQQQQQQQRQQQRRQQQLQQILGHVNQEEEEETAATLRLKLNKIMQEFNALPSSDPWNVERVNSFLRYARYFVRDVLVKSTDHITNQDFEFFNKIVQTKMEPVFFRAMAMNCLGLLYMIPMGSYFSDPLGQALVHFDEAAVAINSMSDEEKQRVVIGGSEPIGAFLTRLNERYVGRIKALSGVPSCMLTWSPIGTRIQVHALAGLRCDCCGQEREEGTILMVCERCLLAHYCSLECQRMAWKEEGHKIVCRKKGEFRVGDIASCIDPFGSLGFGQHVRIKARADAPIDHPNQQAPRSQWEVEEVNYENKEDIQDGPKMIKIIPAARLMRVRPGMWYPFSMTNTLGELLRHAAQSLDNSANEFDSDDIIPDLVMPGEN